MGIGRGPQFGAPQVERQPACRSINRFEARFERLRGYRRRAAHHGEPRPILGPSAYNPTRARQGPKTRSLPWFARRLSLWNDFLPPTWARAKSTKNARILFTTRTSKDLTVCCAGRTDAAGKNGSLRACGEIDYLVHRPSRDITPFHSRNKNLKQKTAATAPRRRQLENVARASTAQSPSLSSFSTAQRKGPQGPSAALDSALIRRYLVTRWGLSTFPGSGISSCRRLT